MKKLIFKNFIYDLSFFFVIALFILGLIVMTLQAVNYFDYVSEEGHSLKIYFSYTFLHFPKIIHRILPFVFFISLFYTIIKYENNDELNIFWLNGISKFKFLNVIVFFSIIVMIIQIILGSYLSPNFQLKARKVLKDSDIDFFTNLIREGKFVNVVKGLTIFAEKKDEKNFFNIFIDDASKKNSRLIYASNGKITAKKENKKFVLYNGEIINIDDDRINIFKFDQIDFDLLSFGSNTIVKPKIQETSSLQLVNCVSNIENIETLKNKTNCSLDSLNKVKQELLKRLYKPIYIPLISILSCLLLFSTKYSHEYNRNKKYIFLLIFLIIVVSETSLKYSTSSNSSLIVYFLIPFMLIITFYNLIYFKINNA
tara:strand:+ start:960 stop:2066 length:1107 start_codon:yes stop_codon:yes gene_type:complete